jgi:hypothetical protein
VVPAPAVLWTEKKPRLVCTMPQLAGEVEAGAFAGIFGSEEGFPDAGEEIGRDAGAGVFDVRTTQGAADASSCWRADTS